MRIGGQEKVFVPHRTPKVRRRIRRRIEERGSGEWIPRIKHQEEYKYSFSQDLAVASWIVVAPSLSSSEGAS